MTSDEQTQETIGASEAQQRTIKVLYLDSDFGLTLSGPDLEGLSLEVTPEIPPDDVMRRNARWLPASIKIREDLALNPEADRMSTYEPDASLLRAIARVTASGRYAWVIIGNNRGAGEIKGMYVSIDQRPRTIIIANGHPPEGGYRALGFQHFASRDALGALLARLIAADESA